LVERKQNHEKLRKEEVPGKIDFFVCLFVCFVYFFPNCAVLVFDFIPITQREDTKRIITKRREGEFSISGIFLQVKLNEKKNRQRMLLSWNLNWYLSLTAVL